MLEAQRNYKDTVFRMLYKEKKEAMELYNALNGTDYRDETALEVRTLENAIFMNVKNDVSFLLGNDINLYEHQSTDSPNLPLRDLFYISSQLQREVSRDNLFGSRLIRIPTPRFVVFYNGTGGQQGKALPDRMVYRLSDAFLNRQEEPELELKVTVLNINAGSNENLLGKCRSLREYMLYVEKVRKYSKTMDIGEAVSLAVDECIAEEILKDFLLQNKSEAIAMSIFEYNEELHLKSIREEGKEEGRENVWTLIRYLQENGSMEELSQALSDKAKREELYQKYNL